uniref:Response regulator VieB n=1 Tax=Rheinheimera sp. BAL341 TaxID=1708203 RepID=A0A486XTB8_9GAMM
MIFQTSFYKTKKILLLEDCEPVRASIKGMLQQIGFEDITTAADVAQAIPLVKSQHFDFILADYELGSGKTALQFFHDLQQQALLKLNCCFLLLSAEPRRLPVFGLIAGTPDGFLLKPFSYVELEKRLAKAWRYRSNMRKVYQALADKNYKAAQLELDQIINPVNASSLLALRLMAEVLIAEGNYAAAVKLYDQVMQQRDFSWARLGRSIAQLQLQQYETAQTDLTELTELDEVRPEALEWLACLAVCQGQFDVAQKHLTDLLRGQNTHLVAHLAYVAVLQLNQQADECSKYLQKLIQQYRFSAFDNADYYFELARLQLGQAQKSSLKDFAALTRKAQESLSAMPQKLLSTTTEMAQQLLRARVQLLDGHIADAKRCLMKLEQDADIRAADSASVVDMARLAFALGEQKTADEYLTHLEKRQYSGTDLLSCCQRLLAQSRLQQEQQLRVQIRDWNQAGMAQAAAGNAKQALALLRQAFIAMPCNPGLCLNVLQVLAQMPAEKTLQKLARNVFTALQFCSLTAANKQRLEQVVSTLPPLYLD